MVETRKRTGNPGAGELMAGLRRERGMEQVELAEAVSPYLTKTVSNKAISHYELGRRMPPTLVIIALWRVLGMEMEEWGR